MRESVVLNRDCPAAVIPGGEQFTLEKGTSVEITQALGGSYTVMTPTGHMVRISSDDADAIGKEVVKKLDAENQNIPIDELVWRELKTCYDPEIPVDIANLGLVYKCEITPVEDGGHSVFIQMTLTAPGCGMGGVIAQDVERKVSKLPDVKQVKVELVWDPPWNQSMMSDAAKLKLGML